MGPINKVAQLAVCLAAFGSGVDAFWRLACRGESAYARIDPLVDTGHVAGHLHAIHGGNALGFDTKPQQLLDSQCTSCEVRQDKSAYWTPALYFQGDNGEFEMVSQAGGMLAYYLLYSNPGEQLVAFPQGFGMLAGDPHRRNFTCKVPEPPKSEWTGFEGSQDALMQKSIGFNCLNYAAAPEPSLYRHHMPEKSFMDRQCTDGLRLEIFFPSCWNGRDLDSADHQSHVAYPSTISEGTCPTTHPKRLPSLFFETIWNTQDFAGKPGRFVLSNGDPTGYGYHADFMGAWENGVLQQAVDTCTSESGETQDCPVFDLAPESEQEVCKINLPSVIKHENALGPMPKLPGDNPILSGPAPAPEHPGAAVAGAADDITSDLSNAGDKIEAAAKPDVQAPAPTAAPQQPPAGAAPAGDAVSTKWLTDGNEVWEIMVEQEIKTVMADQAPARRHIHHKRHHAAGLQ